LDLFDLAILALRIALVAMLYLFLLLVMRVAVRGLRTAPEAASAAPGSFGEVRLTLSVVEAGGSSLTQGQVLEVANGAVLGRAERAEVVLTDMAVSAEHARLARVGRVWVVSDLGSTNGTRVNDVAVHGEMPLAHGDVLGLGNVRLKVVAR
jgi:hypothetical protein